ncbi:MAG TPA: DUF167 domain-containing protein [Rubrobacteraceae bacterium]|nr:DUF167 domain-containing protein [Rubrobacteraceae bacterium]
MAEGFVNQTKDGAQVTLRVSPGARESAVTGTYGESALKVRVAAPPVDGKANEETLRYLAKLLGLPRSRVEILRGSSGRDKVVLVRGVDPEGVRRALSSAIA